MKSQRIMRARSPPSSGQSPLHGKRPLGIPRYAPLPLLSPSNPLCWASMGTPKQTKTVRAAVSCCKAVCTHPKAEVVSVPHRGDEARCWPAFGQAWRGDGLSLRQRPFCAPETSDRLDRKGSAECLTGAVQKVRFYSRIKRWLHRVSHQPATRTETAEKRTISEISVRFRQSEMAPILGV